MTIKTVGKVLPHQRLDVHELLRTLSEFNVRFTIAGGYVRDIILGIEPRDLDICIYGVNGLNPRALEVIQRMFNVEHFEGANSNGSTNDDRIAGVFKLSHPNVPFNIDLIEYSCPDVETTVQSFDFNMNMVALAEPMSKARYVATTYYGGHLGEQGKLFINKSREHTIHEDRRLYMVQKALAAGWFVDEELFDNTYQRGESGGVPF